MNEENVCDHASGDSTETTSKSPYHSPVLQHYGGLAELVQRNPGVGADGGIADCSHS